MIQFKKYIALMIVLLLSCSISWCQSDTNTLHLLTGVEEQTQQDSVLVPISAIKVANAKMIELKYEKETIREFKRLIEVDSNLISSLRTNLVANEIIYNNNIAEIKKQRNIAIGAGGGTSLLLLILLIVL